MRIAKAVALSFAATSAVTLLGRMWPTEHRCGWFELPGRPVAIDGRPVEDWRHVNEILARYAVAAVGNARPQWRTEPNQRATLHEEEYVREFVVDFAPSAADRVQRATVRQHQTTQGFFLTNMHPVGNAKYSVVSVQPRGV